tara:strand:+ start:18770 stop:19411 length:642 start_codon:yes stop_codon:yes gene_type:complete
MNFDDFTKRISKIKNLPLLGEESHIKMAPSIRIDALRKIKNKTIIKKKAAVMVLFYPDDNNVVNLLLMLRNTYKGVHSNQVGFPGGKVEKIDKSLLETALRETFEEVGVPSNSVETIRELSSIYIPPSNFEVQPYIGLYHNPLPFVIEEAEVASLIEVSLSDFMNDKNIITKKISTSYATNIDVPAFKLNGYVVWGATAMIMSELKELLKQLL